MDVYGIIESYIVSQMTPTLTIDAVTVVGTNYRLDMCNTSWISVSDTVTIDGVDYNVESFVQNESITVSGSVQPPVTTFTLDAPYFEAGSHRKVNTERTIHKNSDPSEIITPLIYVMPVRNTGANNQFSLYGFEGKVRVFFLQAFDPQNDIIETHRTNVIKPMMAMAEYFQSIYEARNDVFEDEGISKPEEFEHIDFGSPAVWGNQKNIFDEKLSGVERVFDIKIFESIESCCGTDPNNTLCPDVTTSVEGVATGVDTSPGQNINIQIVDQNGNPVVSTLETNTANIKKLAVTVGGDPSGVDLNGTPLTDINPGNTKVMDIHYANGDPVVITTITDTELEFEGSIPNPLTYYTYFTGQEDIQAIGDDGWQFQNGTYDNTLLTNYYTLASANEWGHFKRYTGDTGGYMDEATGLFYDVNGVATTKALAFPNDILRDYATRRRWYLNRSGSDTWANRLALVGSESRGGETGWRVPSKEEYFSLSSDNINQPTLIDSRLFNWSAFLMWTNTSNPADSTQAYRLTSSGDSVSFAAKTQANATAYIKNF